MRILVTGSRNWTHWNTLNHALNEVAADQFDLTLVHGACPTGADKMADEWAAYQGVRVERYPAEWNKYGKSAGFKRNKKMVDLGADICLAFIKNKSKGASMTARLAEEAGIETVRFTVDD